MGQPLIDPAVQMQIRPEKKDIPELLEGVCAGNVRIQDKEGRVVLAEDLASEGKRTSCRLSARTVAYRCQ